MSAKFTLDFAKVAAEVRKNIRPFIPAIQKGMKQGSMDWLGQQQKNQMTGGDSGLNRRTGTLARSWFVSTVGWGARYIVRVATNVKYARIHQFGGTIKPKNSKFLVVPLTKEARIKNPRDFTDSFVFVTNGGQRIIARTEQKGGKKVISKSGKERTTKTWTSLQFLYLLRKSVKIPKRLYMYEKWQKDGWAFMQPRIYANIMKDATTLSRGKA